MLNSVTMESNGPIGRHRDVWVASLRLKSDGRCFTDTICTELGMSQAELVSIVADLYEQGWMWKPKLPVWPVPLARRRGFLHDRMRSYARKQVHRAVASGRIVKPSECSDCSIQAEPREIHAHHPDHAKPLEVVWLCARCHRARHGAKS